ncbi:hypothetical protein QUB60_28765 [Microcoleus sp. A2-C5]
MSNILRLVRMLKVRSPKHSAILNRQRATNRKTDPSVDMWVC